MIGLILQMTIFKPEDPEKFIAWMAQTVHQAYHQDHPGTWDECCKDICSSARCYLRDRKDYRRLEVAEKLMEE